MTFWDWVCVGVAIGIWEAVVILPDILDKPPSTMLPEKSLEGEQGNTIKEE